MACIACGDPGRVSPGTLAGAEAVGRGVWSPIHDRSSYSSGIHGGFPSADEDGSRHGRLGIPGELVRDRSPAPRLSGAHDLDWSPRPTEETIVECTQSLIAAGVVDARPASA
jgi:hypothetical protein